MIIINEPCLCGNKDSNRFAYYDGCLGYEAIICTQCGRYDDHTGSHEADAWSKKYYVKKEAGISI